MRRNHSQYCAGAPATVINIFKRCRLRCVTPNSLSHQRSYQTVPFDTHPNPDPFYHAFRVARKKGYTVTADMGRDLSNKQNKHKNSKQKTQSKLKSSDNTYMIKNPNNFSKYKLITNTNTDEFVSDSDYLAALESLESSKREEYFANQANSKKQKYLPGFLDGTTGHLKGRIDDSNVDVYRTFVADKNTINLSDSQSINDSKLKRNRSNKITKGDFGIVDEHAAKKQIEKKLAMLIRRAKSPDILDQGIDAIVELSREFQSLLDWAALITSPEIGWPVFDKVFFAFEQYGIIGTKAYNQMIEQCEKRDMHSRSYVKCLWC